ncbi:hypothetical protein J2766_001059 [Agrobacterium tumefaciens]|uniref:Uncharacterized protein n=1 Tax=Agrobacterium tumefaciens TaxID=358 RepID=A0AAW8LPW8_AGRTU|nr:hypothetical protein [Agrobacterium tumefaciens]MBP2564500.1 hypothetical protein [Agrobacterium tumefaciens]MDR6701635.1 hypothetical protein [Agrobacterium tumefaciens]
MSGRDVLALVGIPLKAGHNHFVAVLLNADNIKFFAVELIYGDKRGFGILFIGKVFKQHVGDFDTATNGLVFRNDEMFGGIGLVWAIHGGFLSLPHHIHPYTLSCKHIIITNYPQACFKSALAYTFMPTHKGATMAHGVKLDTLSMEDLQSLIGDAQKALSVKVDMERAELMKKLQALDAIAPAKVSAGRQRNASAYTHKHPKSGHEWLGRGNVPEAWSDILPKDATKEDRARLLAPYRIDLK